MEQAFEELKVHVSTAIDAAVGELEHVGSNVSHILRKVDSVELKLNTFISEYRKDREEDAKRHRELVDMIKNLHVPFDRRPTVKMSKVGY